MYEIRTMVSEDFDSVADLIYLSTNAWYLQNRGHEIFKGGPEVCKLFCDVYEDLDPGCAIVAETKEGGKIIGSCFVHPRETHVSLGILNIHPSYFGYGVAGALVDSIISFSESRGLPLRLVSSALNLDSFSLYSRKGFVPFATYQDMQFNLSDGYNVSMPEVAEGIEVRSAAAPDVLSMGQLEFEVSGISREQDYCYFIENESGIWQTLVVESADGIEGFMVSVDHPGSRMIGPGVARTPEVAVALVHEQLKRFDGGSVVCVVPVDQPLLVRSLYSMGGRNCEIHLGQVRGEAQPVCGVVMPTFMPESA